MDKDRIELTEVSEEQALPLVEVRELLDMIYLVNALFKTGGNVSRAAEKLEIARRTIYDMMEKYGISCTDGKLSVDLKPILEHIELRASCIDRYLT